MIGDEKYIAVIISKLCNIFQHQTKSGIFCLVIDVNENTIEISAWGIAKIGDIEMKIHSS